MKAYQKICNPAHAHASPRVLNNTLETGARGEVPVISRVGNWVMSRTAEYKAQQVSKATAVFLIAPKTANPRDVNVVESSGPKRLSGIAFEAREVAERIYAAMQHAGIKATDARSCVQAAIPNISEPILRDWVT